MVTAIEKTTIARVRMQETAGMLGKVEISAEQGMSTGRQQQSRAATLTKETQKTESAKIPKIGLKGQCHEIFDFWFFS